MSDSTRRSLCQALPAALSLLAFLPRAQARGQAASTSKETDLSHCTAFPFSSLPEHPSASGVIRPVLSGIVPTGEHLELHETTLMPGQMPHPPHQHRHEELMLIREGTLEFQYGGANHTLTAGGAAYVASNEMHGLKNVGTTSANYFVIGIGREEA